MTSKRRLFRRRRRSFCACSIRKTSMRLKCLYQINYMIAREHGDRRFVAIPVFPSRVFRHSYIWINANAGIREPRDLIGKRVGIADYSMTALLFVRGMLKHEYNVLPEDIHWFSRRSEHMYPSKRRQLCESITWKRVKLSTAC